MIKEMVKRDLSSEPFIAKKATKWGRWAAKHLQDRVDWESILLDAVNESPEVTTTQAFQEKLIQVTLRGESWAHYLMAGRLYAPLISKKAFGDSKPSVRELHLKLADKGLMYRLDYSEAEYAEVEQFINHDLDNTYPHFRVEYVHKKYALQNRQTNEIYETPQFVYMRMAMALSEEIEMAERMEHIQGWYRHFSEGRLNAPTPNFVNLGTPLRGFASCCIYSNNDNAASIGIGLHIAYTMTYMSAGCGTHLNTRSLGDSVRAGMIKHQGKLPYIRATKSMVEANLQNGRGGADNLSWSAYDPEGEVLVGLQNPMSVDSRKIRGIDYTIQVTKHIARMAGSKGKLFRFNSYTAPDLYEAMYSDDAENFERLYNKYEADPLFVKVYFNAREQVLLALNEAYETGRYYLSWSDEINRHTPFYDPILATNLCTEIMLPQQGYDQMMDLYSPGPVGYVRLTTTDSDLVELEANQKVWVDRDREPRVTDTRQPRSVIPAKSLKAGELFQTVENGLTYQVKTIDEYKPEPEVAMCNIGAICPSEVRDDAEYADVMYYCLLMIDICINKAHYELPHIGYTSKARMNAGVGMMGLATWMARRGLKFSTAEGKAAIHQLDETHLYHAITQSIRLGKKRGNAEWIHLTRWPEGYLPMDSYNRNVDEITPPIYYRDWDTVRSDLVDNKGMRFSCVVTHMPGESSSKASGQPNSRYPIRQLVMTKTDNGIVSRWAAPDGDILGDAYESAWDLPAKDQMDNYAIGQKFTDQGMSADLWRRLPPGETVGSTEMLNNFFYMTKVGFKSRYYQNTLTTSEKRLEDGRVIMVEVLNTDGEVAADCGAGGCKM